MLDGDSTIYALSTAPGRAAIAVVRASGPACVQVRPRYAALSCLRMLLTTGYRSIVLCAPKHRFRDPGLRQCARYTTPGEM